MKNTRKLFTILLIILLLIGSYFYNEDVSDYKNDITFTKTITDLRVENPKGNQTEYITTDPDSTQTSTNPKASTTVETPEPIDASKQESEPLIHEDSKSLIVEPDTSQSAEISAEKSSENLLGKQFATQNTEVYAEKESEILMDEQKTPPNTEVSAEKNSDSLSCTLSISCASVLKNLDKLKEEKREIIPQSGMILKETTIEFSPGESVFDVLYRETKNNKIHMDFVSSPMYNSTYIKGISNLYEFDCGDLSGWFYKVNGEKPNFGCSQYKIKPNDKIEFYYTCNMFEEN